MSGTYTPRHGIYDMRTVSFTAAIARVEAWRWTLSQMRQNRAARTPVGVHRHGQSWDPR